MSTSPDPGPPAFDANGKFAKGNRLGRGNPMLRYIQTGRVKFIREVKLADGIPKAARVLMQMALRGSRTVSYRKRVTDPDTGRVTVKRVRKTMPVGDKVQLVAIDTLFSRFMGKATEYKVIEDHRPDPGSGAADPLAQLVAHLLTLGLPVELWPVQAREHHVRQVANKVIEPPKEPS